MKTTLLTLALTLLASIANASDFTGEWEQGTSKKDVGADVLGIGEAHVIVKPIPPAKKNDPPRLGLFMGDTLLTKTPLYADRTYHIAAVRKDDKLQWFINGYPDGPAASASTPGDVSVRGSNGSVHTSAMSPEQILLKFRLNVLPRKVLIAAHRGDNHGSPENTNISYVNAVEQHAPIVEMDLRLTKDNVLVLLHDATVDRTTDGKGKLLDLTAAEAQKLDAGTWKDAKFKGEQIPLVETVAKTCSGNAIMMLDLKCTGLGPALAELKKKLNFPADQWILAPWEEAEGSELRKFLPDVPMILLHGKLPPDATGDAYFARMKQIGFSGFSIDWRALTPGFIDAAHKNGMQVYVWTINDAPDIAGAVLAGVDGVVTDNTASTTAVLSDLGATAK